MPSLLRVRFVLVLALSVAALPAAPLTSTPTRLEWLRAEIARHDTLYFRDAAPEITDAEYDALKRELRDLLARQPAAADAAKEDSPGDDRTGRHAAWPHRQPMRGLAKAYSPAELQAFLDRVRALPGGATAGFVVEPKYDGLAISATYADGVLVRVLTRGNGVSGEEVTANLLACADLPRRLTPAAGRPFPALVELRGEAFVDAAEFARLNAAREEAGEPPFAHPRNLAAGTLQAADAAGVRDRRLRVVLFGWGAWEPADSAPLSQQDGLARLRAWGLPGPAGSRPASAGEVAAAVEALAAVRESCGFPNDGAVVKVDAVALRAALGEGPEGPRWAIAYKFPAEFAETTLRAITLQIGRSGLVTPVAELAPVRLGGVVVTRASLHNREQIARRDLRVGDVVRVERAGAVIPVVIGAVPAKRAAEAGPYVFPSACPECAAALVTGEGGARVRCPNFGCPAQVRRRLEHFASPAGVDLPGFGPALIDRLVGLGRLRTPADFFGLGPADFREAGREGGALLAAIDAARTTELTRYIRGFGLPGVGPVTAERAARHFGGLEALARATVADWRAIGLGAEQAERIARAQAQWDWPALIGQLRAAGVRPAGPAAGDGCLAGRRVVFTGRLAGLGRSEAARLVSEAGGVVAERVASREDVVVAGPGAGAKLDEARRLGARILDEAEFRAWLGGSGDAPKPRR